MIVTATKATQPLWDCQGSLSKCQLGAYRAATAAVVVRRCSWRAKTVGFVFNKYTLCCVQWSGPRIGTPGVSSPIGKDRNALHSYPRSPEFDSTPANLLANVRPWPCAHARSGKSRGHSDDIIFRRTTIMTASLQISSKDRALTNLGAAVPDGFV